MQERWSDMRYLNFLQLINFVKYNFVEKKLTPGKEEISNL